MKRVLENWEMDWGEGANKSEGEHGNAEKVRQIHKRMVMEADV